MGANVLKSSINKYRSYHKNFPKKKSQLPKVKRARAKLRSRRLCRVRIGNLGSKIFHQNMDQEIFAKEKVRSHLKSCDFTSYQSCLQRISTHPPF